MPNLIAIEGPLKGQTFRLREAVVLGRSFDADLRLDDPAVSRRHARISLAGGHCSIEDLGSENGTLVNGRRIAAPTPLQSGDQIGLAGNLFRFAAESAPPRESGVTIVDEPSADAPPALETIDVRATSMEAAMAQRADAPDALIKAQQRLRAVLEISNAVQTQLDMDKLLHQIMDRLFGVFPQADRGFIMLKADESEDLVPRAARQRGREQPEAITVSRSIVQKAMGDRVAILSADAMGDQRFSMAQSVLNFRIRSMMCAPIIANEEALGIIHLDTTRQDRQFTRDDLDLLAAVTNQTAFAIANARLLRKLLLQERTERDLQLARQVQESFLPRRSPEVAGMQFCASYKAAHEVGGDFYDFIPLEGGRLAIVVGDVAGKGIPAALMMARMSSALREFALTEDDPRRVVARANDRLAAMEAERLLHHAHLRPPRSAHPNPPNGQRRPSAAAPPERRHRPGLPDSERRQLPRRRGTRHGVRGGEFPDRAGGLRLPLLRRDHRGPERAAGQLRQRPPQVRRGAPRRFGRAVDGEHPPGRPRLRRQRPPER